MQANIRLDNYANVKYLFYILAILFYLIQPKRFDLSLFTLVFIEEEKIQDQN